MKRIISLLLTVVLLVTMTTTITTTVFAFEVSVTLDISKGAITITETGYTANGATEETAYTGDYIITGTTTNYGITVESGTHNITLDGVNISRTNKDAAFVVNSNASVTLSGNAKLQATNKNHGIRNRGKLTISGGTVEAISTDPAYHGIYNHGSGTLTISGENTNVIAEGNNGIYNESNATLNITGGTVNTEGGFSGIQSHGTLNITGGIVRATATGEGVSGIRNEGATLNITGGIVFEGASGKVYGTYDLTEDFTVNDGETLTIPDGTTLTIPEGVTLTNNGTIVIEEGGQLIVNGTLINNGTITNNGTGTCGANNHVKGADGKCLICGSYEKGTTITYSVEPTYTVTIPATVELGKTATISAENVVIEKGTQVEVSLTGTSESDNAFKLKTQEGAELTYTVQNGNADVAVGDTVLTVNPDNSASGETTLSFIPPTGDIQFAGEYTGTVTFTVSVKAAS